MVNESKCFINYLWVYWLMIFVVLCFGFIKGLCKFLVGKCCGERLGCIVGVKYVVVLMGGFFFEWLVSFLLGNVCVDVFEVVGFWVMWIDVGYDVVSVFFELKFDVVFNVLYGFFGEDGKI